MAFGFQNCCDTEEYFYLNGIPATVSENEVYQISTLEGVDFCATYTELPELFYQPLTYTLDVMVEQTSCTTCLESLPCPETIEVPLDNNVTISNYNECSVLTEIPLEVVCRTIQPVAGADFGQIRLQISGGQPPFQVFSANTTTQVYGAAQEGLFTIISQASPGDYCYDVIDSYNAVISLCCTVDYSPEPLVVSCSSTPSGVWEDTGTVSLTINGESPFTVYYQGSEITLPLQNLSAGTYDLTVIDSIGQTDTVSCTVGQTIPNYTYPQYLCMTFQFCGAAFYLTFLSAGTSNYLPYYTLTNPSEIGVTSMTLSADTSFNWFTSTAYSNTSQLNVPPTCSLNAVPNGNVQFTKNTSGQPSPLGNWTSSGIFGVTQTSVTEGQCVEVLPTFNANGNNVCLLDSGSNGIITVIPTQGSGAGAPYTIYVNGFSFGTNTVINGFSPGTYPVQISDVNFNLSTVGSVTVGTTNPQNLSFNACGTLVSSLNSVADYLNADFTATSTPVTWSSSASVTGNLQLTVTYNLITPDFDPNSNQYMSDILAVTGKGAIVGSPFIPSTSTYVSNGGINTTISFNSTPVDTFWIQTASYPTAVDFINRAIFQRTQVWTSTNQVTITNISQLVANINTLIDFDLGNDIFFVQYTSQDLTVNFKLSLINLDVSQGGCYQVDANPTIFEYQSTRTIPSGYDAPFVGQFLNGTGCLTQLNCNQQFQYTSAVGSPAPVNVTSNNSFGTTNILTVRFTYPRANVVVGGTSNNPGVLFQLLGATPLTNGQTYYFRFIFTTAPTTGILYFTFNGNVSTGYLSNTVAFTINLAQVTIGTPVYRQAQFTTATANSRFHGYRTTAHTVDSVYEVQISQCSFV